MQKKRNNGTYKHHYTTPPETRKTRLKGTTALIRSTEYKDAYEERESQLKKRRQRNGG